MDSYKVYSITNKISGRTYVGSTYRSVDIRWKEHCLPSSIKDLSKDIKYFGVSNFEFKVLEEVSPNKVMGAEKKWMLRLKSLKSMGGYNSYLGFFKVFL